jgi:hypothetical protein
MDLEDQSQSNTGDTPEWAGVLEQIPPQFRDQVTPALEQWHHTHQQKYTEVEQRYAPWKTFIDQGIDPGQVQSAWGLAAALEQNPVQTVNTIKQYLENQGVSFTDQQVQQAVQQAAQQPQADLDPALQARFDELKRQQDILAGAVVKQHEQKLAETEDAKLAKEFDSLHKKMTQKFGRDFNEQFVGPLALATGMSLEQAAEAYYAEVNAHVQQSHRPAPTVLGAGGGLPAVKPNIRQMNENEFNSHVADLVRTMKQQ